MDKAPKLNTVIQTNIPLRLRIKKYGGEFDDKFNPGKKTYFYVFTDEKGNEYTHSASAIQHEALSIFQEGDLVQVVRTEKMSDGKRMTYYNWTPPEGAEARAAATPQFQSNTAVQRQERQQEDHQKAARIKDACISLQGLVQAYIIQGREDPLEAAILMREQIIKEATKIVSPKPGPEPADSIF